VPTTLIYTKGGTGTPAIAFGVPLSNSYQLYFAFPLSQQQQTLQLVQTTLTGVGIALIALLAAITSLVTRWVVLPVRHAARAAQRLSTGELEERMVVGGADDLASPPRSTTWPTAFRRSCANLRNCPRCSGSSSPTSRTSCAPR
jgi:hypothetical protein